jgi:hypothetical protein
MGGARPEFVYQGWDYMGDERRRRLEARVAALEAAIVAHIEARDAYFSLWARKAGWHDGSPVNDGEAVRETWRALRELVGR